MTEVAEKKIRVFNLTDVATPELEAHHLLNATLAVHCHLIPPGESLEIPATDLVMRDVGSYVKHGALAVDRVPASYTSEKEKQSSAKLQAAQSSAQENKEGDKRRNRK